MFEVAVIGRSQCPTADVNRDIGIRQRPPEQIGAREVTASRQRERRDLAARAIDVKVATDRAGKSLILEPMDGEPFAEPVQR